MFASRLGAYSVRGYATLKDIQVRLKAIKNIGKITKSMKMIAATKMNRAQKAMEVGRAYGQTVQTTVNILETTNRQENVDSLNNSTTPTATATTTTTTTAAATTNTSNTSDNNVLVLACSSDRGLCGAIHSSVSKLARKLAKDQPQSTNIVVLGDKAKPQIARDCRQNIILSFNQLGKAQPSFLDALIVLQNARELPMPFNKINIIYNRFVSVISYDTTLVSLPNLGELKQSPRIAAYEVEDEVLVNYVDFIAASRLFWALAEGHAAEMAAKRTAMENATKNADEMVNTLTMKYNRTRQAVITNELVDIIVGASAL